MSTSDRRRVASWVLLLAPIAYFLGAVSYREFLVVAGLAFLALAIETLWPLS